MTHPLIASRRGALILAAGGTLLPFLAAGRAVAQASAEDYMVQMSQAGTFTMAAAMIGLEKAENPMLRQFAELEIAEIQAVMEVLMGAGAPPPPEALEGEKGQMLAQLQEAPAGPEFDPLFLQAQIMGHEEGLQIQQLLADETEITVPVATAKLAEESIRSHLVMLQTIQSMMG